MREILQSAVTLSLLVFVLLLGASQAQTPRADPFDGVGASAFEQVDSSDSNSSSFSSSATFFSGELSKVAGSAVSNSAPSSSVLSSGSSGSSGWTVTPEISLGLGSSSSGAPDPSVQRAGRFLAEDLSAQKEQILFRSFFRNDVVLLPPQTKEIFESRDLRDAWEGNSATISTGFVNFILRFRREVAEEGAPVLDKDPEYFDIRLGIRDKLLIIQHTEGRTRGSKEGIPLPFPPPEQERLFIGGRGASGMAVLLPRTQTGGQYARALLLCPRSAFTVRRGPRQPEDTFFVESPYRLARTIYGARAKVEGRALSGGGVGLAKAEILTTPNVPRSQEWEDSSYGVDPSVALTYVPFTSEQLADVDQDGAVVAAIEGRLTLQRPAGFKRVTLERSLLWFKEFPLTNEQPWFIRIRGDRPPARVAPGRCYSVLLERLFEQRYTREELKLPDRLR